MVRGAILGGLGIGMACPDPVQACPYHLGVVITEIFASYKHKAEDLFHDEVGRIPRAKGQLHWLLAKGDLIQPMKPTVATYQFTKKFQKKDIKTFRLLVVINNADEPPTRKADAKPSRQYPRWENEEHGL